MTPLGYKILGWAVWQVASRVFKEKFGVPNRAKLGAAGVVALVLIAGVLAARSDDDS